MAREVKVLGIPFSLLSLESTAKLISKWMDDADEPNFQPRQVVTANPEIVMYANQSEHDAVELHNELLAADLITPDGIGIVMALRLQGHLVEDRVTGADLTPLLLQHCAKKGYRVFLLGASESNSQEALLNLSKEYPNVVFQNHHGYFSEDGVGEILEKIVHFKPHLLLVGLGLPRQEHFIARYREYMRVPVSIGVGGVIDIFSGRVKRSPEIWIRLRLEWLHRLLLQPSRLKRQLVLPKFAWIIFKNRWAGK